MKITPKDASRRLDKFLFQYLNDAPHSFIYKMLRKKRIKLNGKRAQGSEILSPGDELQFYISPETIASFRKDREITKAKPLAEIVFEDDNLLVVNKPPGLPSHGGMNDEGDHLLAQVLYYLYKSGAYSPDATFVPALCNRLDVNTSGLVICGKNLRTLQEVNGMFARNQEKIVNKEYIVVVEGIPGEIGESRVLEGYYEKNTKTNTARIVKDSTKMRVITEYSVVAISKAMRDFKGTKKYSMLKVSPLTGRSHQIRVHMASIGNPIAGDKKYGASQTPYAPAQLLHCNRIDLPQYGMSWEAEMPEGFARCLGEWF